MNKNSSPKKSKKPHQDALTKAKQRAFLTALALHGTITAASLEVGLDRSTHYDWMNQETYAEAFHEAEHIYADSIRDEVRQRGRDGWLEPVVYQGQIQYAWERDKYGERILDKDDLPIAHMVVIRKKSDRLLELLAKAKCSEFRDKLEHSVGEKTLEQLLSASYEAE